MKKRIIACLMAAVLLCSSVCALAAPPQLSSASACLMDAETGQILYEKNAKTKLAMASITKVMTALIVIEEGDLSASTVATQEALDLVDADSTRIGFVAGEQLTVDELMYCMLVYSANDAANVLAACVGGSVEAFVERMNERAQELGCTNTHFANPNGLDAEGHYSCAEDMARITYAANQYEEFSTYSSAVSYRLPADNIIPEGWAIWTKVNMLRQSDATYDSRIYAAKTGWTTNAHNTFVACGKSENANFVVSVLNCPVKNGIFVDTTALLDYGEQCFASVTVEADEYKIQAKQAAKEADCRLDLDALNDFSIKMPVGMDADDLSYVCVAAEGKTPYLAVLIAEDSREEYAAATGMDGTVPLIRVPVTIKPGLLDIDATEAAGSSETDWLELLNHLSETQQSVVLVGIVVIGAGLLMLVIRLMIGVYRKKRK